MKPNFKTLVVGTIMFAISAGMGCKKESTSTPATNTQPATPDNYASVQAFFAKNGVPMQTYTITGSIGGSFTTPQGTKVVIPPNAFLDPSFHVVTGPVTIQFKDIYKKSDMLLSDIPPMQFNGAPLKSGGEFFIKAMAGGSALTLGPNPIKVTQPLNGLPMDTAMRPFIKKFDTAIAFTPWQPNLNDSVIGTISNYVFSLYSFQAPVDSGSWCNSDNSDYFSAYTQTQLTLIGTDFASIYGTTVFLMFKGLNSMVHVYNGGYSSFPYYFAPQGLQCTVVAFGVKAGKVYSSFTPITISANQVVNFTMSLTTTAAFDAAVAALN